MTTLYTALWATHASSWSTTQLAATDVPILMVGRETDWFFLLSGSFLTDSCRPPTILHITIERF